MSTRSEFLKFNLDFSDNFYGCLIKSIDFGDVVNGKSNCVFSSTQNDTFPIVRTATKNTNSIKKFKLIHDDIGEVIKNKASLPNKFNNAMAELNLAGHKRAKFHSEQSLDLMEDSHIAIFTCYPKNTKPSNYHKLVVKNKKSGEISSSVLENNSVILFSIQTNFKFWHKIVPNEGDVDSSRLSMIFRCSKTYVAMIKGIPILKNGKELTLATEEEELTFYYFCGQENRNIVFEYPEINYTVSYGDLLFPV